MKGRGADAHSKALAHPGAKMSIVDDGESGRCIAAVDEQPL